MTHGIDFGDLPDRLDEIARTADPDREVPLAQEYDGFCPHRHAKINSGMRRLRCRDCGADLDPFTFLVTLTSDAGRWIEARKNAEMRARAAQGRLNDLLRQERNAKARLARLKKRPGDTEVQA